jgi:hypothetical protein
MISHESTCRFIRTDKACDGILWKHPHQLKHRKHPVAGKRVVIPDKVSIDQRLVIETITIRDVLISPIYRDFIENYQDLSCVKRVI